LIWFDELQAPRAGNYRRRNGGSAGRLTASEHKMKLIRGFID